MTVREQELLLEILRTLNEVGVKAYIENKKIEALIAKLELHFALTGDDLALEEIC